MRAPTKPSRPAEGSDDADASQALALRAIAATSLGVALAASLLFGLVLVLVLDPATLRGFDRPVLAWFTDLRSGGLNAIARFTTDLASSRIVHPVVVFVCLALLFWRRVALASFVVATTAGTAVLTAWAKNAVGRHRPPHVSQVIGTGGKAFPSGHSSQALALALSLAVVVWCVWRSRQMTLLAVAAAALFALTIGLTRMYLGVHWLTDVVGGWLLATAWLGLLGGLYTLGAMLRLRTRRPAPS